MAFQNTALVITSIAPPNTVLQGYAAACSKQGIHFIVIGDTKSPSDFKLDGCHFFSIEQQLKMSFQTAQITPTKHYARKNIGYLEAIQNGATTIIETDDDNLPYASFWEQRKKTWEVDFIEQKGWLNIYNLFTPKKIWPRGYPLEFIHQIATESGSPKTIDCPIQAGLANQEPDVDAVYRLVIGEEVTFEDRAPIVLGKHTWCPFNSQNTTWFKEAFPLLYLPATCSMRMTDIVRGFVAQRIAWANDWYIQFHKATVYQERNEHNLIHDFKGEISGYLNNDKIVKALSELELIPNDCFTNLDRCYQCLVELEIVTIEELDILKAWKNDLNSII